MRNEELESDLKQLSDEEREETEYLLQLARARKIAKPSRTDVEKRSEKKNIPFVEARRELINESRPLQGEIVSDVRKRLKSKLSKDVRRKLGVKSAGRPPRSKNIKRAMSKKQFYEKLKEIIESNNQIGNETTQAEAARRMDLGGTRQLRRKLREYGDNRRWKALVVDLLTE